MQKVLRKGIEKNLIRKKKQLTVARNPNNMGENMSAEGKTIRSVVFSFANRVFLEKTRI